MLSDPNLNHVGQALGDEVRVLAAYADPSARIIEDKFPWLAPPRAEREGDVFEIGHAAHVDPGLRHRHHDIGKAEAEAFDQHHARAHLHGPRRDRQPARARTDHADVCIQLVHLRPSARILV